MSDRQSHATITIYISDEFKVQVKASAKAAGQTMNDWIFDTLKQRIAGEKPDVTN